MSDAAPGPEAQRRLQEAERLLEISAELSSSLDLDRVLELALIRAEEVCAAETSSLWEVDDGARELFFRVVRGVAAGHIENLRVPLGEGIVGSVAETGQGEVVADPAADPRWLGEPVQGFTIRGILAVPLFARGRVIGVLQLLNPISGDSFRHDDLRRMELLAGPLAQAIDNARLYTALKRGFLDTIDVLAEAAQRRDPYTAGHLERVVAYSLLLGGELGMGGEELEDLRLASTLHDIGKIGTPDAILGKPDRLTAEEEEVMKRHVEDGVRVVERITALRHLAQIVRSHHERVDGAGYPDGLDGERIPLPARILAVADAYDAMTTSRPYREGLAPEVATARILASLGTQFCPRVGEAFRSLWERGEWRLEAGRELADAQLLGSRSLVPDEASPLTGSGADH